MSTKLGNNPSLLHKTQIATVTLSVIQTLLADLGKRA